MEETGKTVQSSVVGGVSGKSKLRYPLRSASKNNKDDVVKSPEKAVVSVSNTSKRGRPPSVSRSVSVLELSSKEKTSAKPPRRLSIPTKSAVSPRQKSTLIVTPISESRTRGSASGRDNCVTPLSEVSRSSVRRKFNVLASASYWLSQIKLSESAGKHSISFGFFKLALEAGCETLQRLRDELKFYAQRHNLAEFSETVKSLFESYEITESLEQLQVSETCSHVPEDSTTPSSEDLLSTSSTGGTRKLKPKSLNTDTYASSANVPSIKENAHRTRAVNKTRASANRNAVSSDKVIKKSVQKAGKEEPKEGVEKIKKQGDYSSGTEGAVKTLDVEETRVLEGNKENIDAPLMGEASVIEAN